MGSSGMTSVKFFLDVSGWPTYKCRRNIAENFDRLSRVHERCRQTDDRQTNGQQHSEREREFTFAKIVMWFGVIIGRSR